MSYSPSSSVVAARKALATRLQDIRKDAGITGRELSIRCGWHPSKTSRIQDGKAALSEADVRAWCYVCGAEDQIDDLIMASRAVEMMYVEWRRMERAGLRQAQESVYALYERTHTFRVYASRVMPGMVQTRAYTTAVLQTIQRSRVPIDDVEAAVESRMERQRMLFSRDRSFTLLIEESVLRSVVCDAEVMAGQLRHLIDLGALRRLSLGIIPAGPSRARSPAEDFYMFDDVQVSVELVSGYLRLTQSHEVGMYAHAFAELSKMAVYGARAHTLITAAIGALG